jgi:antitoxin YefM
MGAQRPHYITEGDPLLRKLAALTGVLELYRVPVPTMAIQTTYTQARAELAKLCDAAAKDNEIVIISRRGAEDVALVSAAELRSLRETAHLLRSPRNAERLLRALARAQARRGRPQSLRSLRREVGLDEAEG